MKKINILLIQFIIAFMAFSQSPDAFNYQMTIRDNANQLVTNQTVGVQFSIQEDNAGGTTIYQESHFPTANAFGIVNLQIGQGAPVIGVFSDIDWVNHDYYIEIGVDYSGGNNFNSMGTVQFISVPYSKVAENVINNDDADANPTNEIQTLSIVGNTISLSNGGGSVTMQSFTAGSGITISGSNVISNTAPDQVVSLTGSGATTVTGVYPSFNISSTDNVGLTSASDPTWLSFCGF